MGNRVPEITQFEHDSTNAIKTKKTSLYGWDGSAPVKVATDSSGNLKVSSFLNVQEEDGTPSVDSVDTIKVTNGTLTDNGDGSVSLTTGGGGGGDNNKVAIDSLATEDFLGSASSDGVLRTSGPISYTDGGDFVTLDISTDSIKDTHIDWGAGAGQVDASDIPVGILSSPTYTTIQDWSDTTQSAGKISGGGFTDNGDGTIAVAAGTGIIKTTDSDTGANKFFDWSADATVALTNNDTNYVYVDYNAGSPQIATSTTIPADKNTNILLGLVYREGTAIHSITAGQVIANYAHKDFWKDLEINGKFQRVTGLVISETGTRNFATTAGSIYAGVTKQSIGAFDSSGADTFVYYYRDGAGGWTKVTAQSQIDNTQYDDGSGTLATLTSSFGWRSYYGVHWVYMDADGDLFVVYGQGDYLLGAAQDAQPPSSLPDLLTDIGGLVGKIIIKKSASTFQEISSAFDVTFTPAAVSEHNLLAGLQGGTSDEYYHLTATTYGYIDQDVTEGAGPAFTDAVLTTPALGTPSAGVLSSCTGYEGTAIASTGEGGGTKFLREDGDGTCSWQTPAGGGTVTQHMTLPVQSAKINGGFVTAGASIEGGEATWALLFDATSTESAVWQFRMPSDYSSALTAKIQYTMASATSGKVDWEVEVMAVADGEDPNTASFDSVNEVAGGTTVPGTAGQLDSVSITLTNADSIAAGELCIIRINRDHDDADDTATGDAELRGLTIEWST